MKKIIPVFTTLVLVIVMAIFAIFLCHGTAAAWGNQAWFDTTYTFDYAYVLAGDGVLIQGAVQSWQDYEDSDVVQVKIDGKVYLTHYSNVILVPGR